MGSQDVEDRGAENDKKTAKVCKGLKKADDNEHDYESPRLQAHHKYDSRRENPSGQLNKVKTPTSSPDGMIAFREDKIFLPSMHILPHFCP